MARLSGCIATLAFALQAVGSAVSESSTALLHGRGVCPISTCHQPAPRPPKDDPWYMTPPTELDAAAPGSIVRIRKAPGNLTAAVTNSSEAFNILYRTTDSRYEPTWAVATLFVPIAPATASILLSYQIAYDSVDVNGSPSYTLYTGSEQPDIEWALGRGWHVLTGDYEGPLASFTAGVMSGHAVLDGVRAVLSSDCKGALGFSDSVRYALWGYSGGALASEWATELQVQYAPELSFSAAALGGLTPNVTNILSLVDDTVSASLIPGWLLGVTSQFPDAREYLISVLKKDGPYNASTFLGFADSTSSAATFVNQEMGKYFVHGLADLEAPLIKRVTYSDGIMGYHGVPQMPVYAYKAIHDELSAGVDTDKLIERYCEVGASIYYTRNTVGDHVGEYVAGDPRARAWLVSVMEQGHVEVGCRIETITDPAS